MHNNKVNNSLTSYEVCELFPPTPNVHSLTVSLPPDTEVTLGFVLLPVVWFSMDSFFFLIFSLSLMSFNVLCVYVDTCVHLSLFLIVFVLWSELSYCSGIVHNSVINYPHILSLFFFPSNIAFYREFNIFDLALSRLFFLLVFVSSVNLSGCFVLLFF